jgi:hypothetical protein
MAGKAEGLPYFEIARQLQSIRASSSAQLPACNHAPKPRRKNNDEEGPKSELDEGAGQTPSSRQEEDE